MYDILIAGAGVVGSMIARELSKYNLSVCLIEKENDVATGASKANSGIIHGGYDPVPNTLKAKLNTIGVNKLFNAATELNVPFKKNGSMVCAFSKDEEAEIYNLYKRGIKNKVDGLDIISGVRAREIEPNLSNEVTLVMQVTNAGIICPYKLTIAAAGNAMDNGVKLVRNFEISKIQKKEGCFELTSSDNNILIGKYLINCAGCFSDNISRLAGDDSFKIILRKGEYLLFDKTQGNLISHTIFGVPTKEGKGILVTPTVDGNLLIGPTATRVDTELDKKITSEGIDLVKRLANKLVNNIDYSQVITSFAGIRSSEEGGDFIIKASSKTKGLINVAAIDSPGLTCSASIAEYVIDILRDVGVVLEQKASWDGRREDDEAFKKMSTSQKNEIIKGNRAYGRVVCRCESVTEGEIRAAINKNPRPFDLDGIKRRTRSGMGRCQGGFCTPYIMQILAEESKTDVCGITKSGKASKIVTGRI